MAELSTRKRNAEPKSDFGLPEEHKYPMPDKSHAANAKARASQQEEKGNLSGGRQEEDRPQGRPDPGQVERPTRVSAWTTDRRPRGTNDRQRRLTA